MKKILVLVLVLMIGIFSFADDLMGSISNSNDVKFGIGSQYLSNGYLAASLRTWLGEKLAIEGNLYQRAFAMVEKSSNNEYADTLGDLALGIKILYALKNTENSNFYIGGEIGFGSSIYESKYNNTTNYKTTSGTSFFKGLVGSEFEMCGIKDLKLNLELTYGLDLGGRNWDLSTDETGMAALGLSYGIGIHYYL